ncbi:MAG: PAS domain S-box protein [Nitrospirota bacterium]
MIPPPIPPDEAQRLAALHALHILDTPPEERFDRITRLAQRLFDVPIALISLVDASRQWFKSRAGLDVAQTPREISFCGHAILGHEAFVVRDARVDPRFSDNPLVTGEPAIRFYAGWPLADPAGRTLGTLCLIDRRPRQLSEADLRVLRDLASLAEQELTNRELLAACAGLRESEERFRVLVESSPSGMVIVDETGTIRLVNAELERQFGYSRTELVGRPIDMLVPVDARGTHADFRAEYFAAPSTRLMSPGRELSGLRKDGTVFPVEIGLAPLETSTGRQVLASIIDISARRQAEQEQRRLAAILEATSDFVGTADLEGRALYVNAAGRRMCGISDDEDITKTVIPDFHPAWAARLVLEEGVPAAMRDGIWRGETALRRPDGTEIPVSQVIIAHKDRQGRLEYLSTIMHDISERKRAEETLRASEERYALAVRGTSDGLWDRDILTNTEYWSPRFRELVGYHESELRSTFESFVTLLHPDDVDRVTLALRAHLERRKPYDIEYRLRTKSGTYRWFRSRGQAVWNEAGWPVRMAGAITDITDRKSVEEELRATKKLLRAMLDHTPAVVYAKDLNGRYLFVNRRHEQVFGRTHEETVGRSDDELFPGRQVEVYRAHDREVLSTLKAIEYEETAVQEGQLHTYLSVKFPLLDSSGRPFGVCGISTDITDRKEAEEELRELTDRLQAIVQASPVAVIAIDPGGIVTMWNPAAERIFGWSEAEVVGRLVPFVPDDKREEFRTLLERVLRGESLFQLELERRRKDGTLIQVNLSAAPLRDSRGKIYGIMAVLGNVTERKQLEEQLRQATKMEAIGRLAGGVAHDFNNMLTAIRGYSELLVTDLPENDRKRHQAEEILKAAERAASLTQQLLAFSRRQVIQPKTVDLNALLTDLMGMLRRVIGEDIRLVARLEPGLWPVTADPGQLEQVVLNLAVNARDAMPQGGVLTIETANAREERPKGDGPDGGSIGAVQLTVHDTGSGMDAGTLARIFEPFFTTKELGRGTGLGLATVYGIVQQSGGTITADSTPGQGTTFTIRFPRAQSPVADVRALDGPAEVLTGSETILVVEDEPFVRQFLKELLAGRGYQVLEAASGAEALARCEAYHRPIHLLLTDVVMPEMNGRQLAQMVVAKRPEIRVLFMSGYTDDAVLRHGVQNRSDAFIQKPYAPEALLRKIREVLSAEG